MSNTNITAFKTDEAKPSYCLNACTKLHESLYVRVKKSKTIPVTDREGPQGCETFRVPHFLDNWLTDGGKVVSHMRRPRFTPRNLSGTHFC
jgi:hypothetical protein